jgi:hypothetical protein
LRVPTLRGIVMNVKKKTNLSIITEADFIEGSEAREVPASEPISVLVNDDAIEVVVLDAHRPLGQIVTTLLRAWQGEEERSQHVISALLPSTVPSTEATEQLRLNAEARSKFLEEFPALPATELAGLAGITWSNPAAWPSRLQKEGKVFSVEYARRQHFPTFQFDSNWQPRDPVTAVLAQLGDAGLQGWSIALWWTAANGWLEGARPVDLLDEEPEQVVAAAGEVGRFPF